MPARVMPVIVTGHQVGRRWRMAERFEEGANYKIATLISERRYQTMTEEVVIISRPRDL